MKHDPVEQALHDGTQAPVASAGAASTSPPVQKRPSAYRYVVVAILTLIYAFNFLDRSIISILNEPIKYDLHLSDTQMGTLSGLAFALFYTTFGIPVAWLADRYNRVRIIAVACTLWSVCCMACGLAGNFVQLLAARVGVGVGEAGGSPPSHSVISDYFAAHERGRALALFSVGIALGPSLGSAAAVWVAAHWGWRVAFYAVGAPGVLLAILALSVVREPKRGTMDGRSGGTAPSPGAFFVVLRDFLRNRAFVLISLSCGMAAFVGYSIGSWMPATLMRAKGMTLVELGYYAVASGTVGAIGTITSGYLVDWASRRSPRAYALVPAGAVALSIPCYAGAIAVPSWQFAIAFLMVPSLFMNMFLPPSLAALQNLVPAERRTSASAMLLFVLNFIGLGAGPLYVGALSDHFAPMYGKESLPLALAGVLPFALLTVFMYYLASRAVEEAFRRRKAGAS